MQVWLSHIIKADKKRRLPAAALILLLFAAGTFGCGSADAGEALQAQEAAMDAGKDASGEKTGAKDMPDDEAEPSGDTSGELQKKTPEQISLEDIPAYAGDAYVAVNGNLPYFSESDCSKEPFEHYSEFDALGRCGAAFANICLETMPTKERGPIGQVRPSGWHTVKYDIVDGNYLYNRCHLIGYQLAAENANEQNLITGTRYLNTEGMLPFENQVADYVKETDHHVLYRVTPMFEGDNLVADGVLMEAWSVEDGGAGVCFNVFVYNVQPGIGIDFATGESWLEDGGISVAGKGEKDGEEVSEEAGTVGRDAPKQTDGPGEAEQGDDAQKAEYVLNTNTMKFHDPACSSVDQISEENKQEYVGTREELIAKGYDPCGRCHP